MIDRRTMLTLAAGLVASTFPNTAEAAGTGLKFGLASGFSFDELKQRAERLAKRAYKAAPSPPAAVLDRVDYDAHGKIRFKPDLALWAEGPSAFPVTFFHLGRFFRKPVRMHVLEGDKAREIIYDQAYFDMPADSPGHEMPENSGFAGFRFQENRKGGLDWKRNDWVAFLGASYFRAIGELYQYGLSARGLAVDTAVYNQAEEFPDFTHIYLETPPEGSDTVTVYALMDSPSVTGAFRFLMRRTGAVTIDVEKSLFMRKAVKRLGLAPLTSMYWYSETRKPTAIDWRPEIHDSDGLALWTGAGERVWRPLNNPGNVIVSSFSDDNPRGFGLMQRDRDFDHYQDGVRYERRPSLWIEPLNQWGKGAVQLVEIPTDDEIHDNIVAFFVPAEPAEAGDSYDIRYRMHWLADEPYPSGFAVCLATRLGNGGQAGQPRPQGVRKFVLEFKGAPLSLLAKGVMPEPVLSTSRGVFSNVHTEAVPNDMPGHWRIEFDLAVQGTEPVEMRCFLRSGGTILSETWAYQYHPF
jgi:periplasmic glucans biosynthesis protein